MALPRPLRQGLAWGLSTLGPGLGRFFDRDPRLPRASNILVIHPGGVGDWIELTPMLRALWEGLPEATLIALHDPRQRSLDLVRGLGFLSGEIPFDRTGRDRSPAAKMRLLWRLRARRFDLALVPLMGPGMIECVLMAFLSGARQRIGIEQEGAGLLFTVKVPRQAHLSATEHNLELARALGLRPRRAAAEISLRPEELRFGQRFWEAHAQPAGRPRVAFHPGAQWAARLRCWPASRFAALGRALVAQTGSPIALLGGPSERATCAQIASALGEDNLVNMCAQTTLGQAAGQIAAAHLLVANDSGLMHVARATGTPCVAVFGPSSPVVRALPEIPHRIVRQSLPCVPCHQERPFVMPDCLHARCLRTLPVQQVLEACLELLEATGRGRSPPPAHSRQTPDVATPDTVGGGPRPCVAR